MGGRDLQSLDDVTGAVFRAKKQANKLMAAARNASERDRITRFIDHCNKVWALAWGLQMLKENRMADSVRAELRQASRFLRPSNAEVPADALS